MRRLVIAVAMVVALVYGTTLLIASRSTPEPFTIEISVVEQANTCRARPISGTGSGSSYGVFLDGQLASSHTTPRRAISKGEALLDADSTAQIVVIEYLWMIFQDNKANDCAPRSERPPWPIALRAVPPPPDSVVVLPDSASLIVADSVQMTAVLWIEGLPWVCPEYGPLWEAKLAANRSRACAVSDGARFHLCDTPQPVLEITSEQECPSIWEEG